MLNICVKNRNGLSHYSPGTLVLGLLYQAKNPFARYIVLRAKNIVPGYDIWNCYSENSIVKVLYLLFGNDSFTKLIRIRKRSRVLFYFPFFVHSSDQEFICISSPDRIEKIFHD